MKKLSLGLMAVMLAFTVGCGAKKEITPIDNSTKIIQINKSFITENDFKRRFDSEIKTSFLAQQKIDINAPEQRLLYLVIKDKIVNSLIIKELIKQEIQKRNIKISDKDVNQEIDILAKNVGSVDKLKSVLAQNNVDFDDFKNNIKNDLKVKKLIDSLAITKVSDKDVKKFYDENKTDKFTNPDQVRASHILISASLDDIKTRLTAIDENLSEDEATLKAFEEIKVLKNKAEQVLREVKANPNDFANLAKKYSEDFSSAKKGGDLGFFTHKEMVKEFSNAAFSLKPDTISGIVKSDFGYHIIKVTDRKKAGITPFNEVKPEIKTYLENQNKLVVMEKFIKGLKNSAKITFNNEEYDPSKIKTELQKITGKKPAQKSVK